MNDEGRRHKHYHRGGGGALYFVGFIGALVYFLRVADGFWDGVLGVLKSFVWPAILVYDLFTFLRA
jgi:hypothetical protein